VLFTLIYKGSRATLAENYPEFYLVDGGIDSSSLGVNSAVAFRIAENIVGISNLLVEPVIIGTKTIYFPR
jgi:hypothetical protein